jgi:hypothetical protein
MQREATHSQSRVNYRNQLETFTRATSQTMGVKRDLEVKAAARDVESGLSSAELGAPL